MKLNRCIRYVLLLTGCVLAGVFFVSGQTPDEHAKHHPQNSTVPADPSMPMQKGGMGSDTANGLNSLGSGGMSGGMEDMMKQMGVPAPKDIYPSLMELQQLPAEKLEQLKAAAAQRVKEGTDLIHSGQMKLMEASHNNDLTALQEGNDEIRKGQQLLENGLAAQRAIAEGKAPGVLALQWFRQNMNLAPTGEVAQPHGFFGLTWFHYVVMFTLLAFAAAMIWMYFYKMKRASVLVAKLAGTTTQSVPLPAGAASLPPVAIPKPGPVAVNPEIAPTKSNSWSGVLQVAEIFEETTQVKTFRFIDPDGGKLPFTYLPGQFITVTISPKGVPVKRSYTIASSPTIRDYCEITVKHEEQGTVSNYLHTMVHRGELMQINGPSGNLTFTEPDADSIVLIAGGVGVTPMMSVIRYLTDRSWKGDIFFFFSVRDEASIIFREEILYLQKRHPNLHVHIIMDIAGGNDTQGFLTGRINKDMLTTYVPDLPARRIHICGPPPMMNAVKAMLEELQVPKENVRTEIFGGKPKPKEAATSSVVAPSAPVATPSANDTKKLSACTFVKSRKTAVLPPGKTILEASEDVGVNIDYSCRMGTCGICKTRLLSGSVSMEVEEALTKEDKAQNIILACQAKATSDVSVDA